MNEDRSDPVGLGLAHEPPRLVEDRRRHLLMGNAQPDRPGAPLARARIDRRHAACFGEAVSLDHLRSGLRLEIGDQLGRHRRRAAQRELEPDEFGEVDRLDLRLAVNGVARQSDSTANLVLKPAETISELSTFANIAPGDVLLTGTPSGCALRLPPPAIRKLVQLLPERQFWKPFLKSQSRRSEYLQTGDRINATIRSADGRLDLGEQVIRMT